MKTASLSNVFFLVISVLAITLPGIGSWLESSMLLHVLLQLPLLVILGWCAGEILPRAWVDSFNQFNRLGFTGVLIMSAAGLFWMLPSALDAAVNDYRYSMIKVASMTVFIGMVFSVTNKVIHPIVKGVFFLEAWAMLGRLGYIYKVSPERLCNSYLLNEQQWLGTALIYLAIAFAFVWALRVLFGFNCWTLSASLLSRDKCHKSSELL